MFGDMLGEPMIANPQSIDDVLKNAIRAVNAADSMQQHGAEIIAYAPTAAEWLVVVRSIAHLWAAANIPRNIPERSVDNS